MEEEDIYTKLTMLKLLEDYRRVRRKKVVKKYNEKNNKKIYDLYKENRKILCTCGETISKYNKYHFKSKKHILGLIQNEKFI